ncbi:hypothetical protein BC830DRAFT_17568 [Chytriomyces sp. MP71]|nr:hypothetical protein BC830DRAFT_17568 [Chytriomyces sp. MP71]
MAALLLFILCIMCQDRRNVGVLASYPNVIPFVVKSVTRPKDVLITLPRSKYERTFVEDVKRLILVSDIVEPTQVGSVFHLASFCFPFTGLGLVLYYESRFHATHLLSLVWKAS